MKIISKIFKKDEGDEEEKKKVFGPEEALARIGMEILYPSETNMALLSDLTPKEILYLASLKTVSEVYEIPPIYQFILEFLKFRVSRLRLGRKELILFGTGIREEMARGGKAKGLLSGLG